MAKIKICGLCRNEDIDYVNEAMPDYTGFVIGVPQSHRNVSEEQVRILKSRLNRGIQSVGVFVDAPIKTVAELYRAGSIDIIQLHGTEDEVYIKSLRSELPGAEIWKAFSIIDGLDLKRALNCIADRILLDSGRGTGICFDWSVVSETDTVKRPFILAGGLRPDNIEEAVKRLRPWAVDLSSGVESEGIKDRDKIQAAVFAVRKQGD